MKGFLALFLGLLGLCTAYKTYSGYQVYSVTPQDENQLNFLRNLQTKYNQFDFLTDPVKVGRSVSVLIPPNVVLKFKVLVTEVGLEPNLKTQDFGKLVSEERERLKQKKVFDINDFNTYDDTMDQLDVWAADCPAAMTCTVGVVGTSYEGREIKSFTMSTGPGKQAVYIDGLIHPREYIVGSTVNKFIDHIVSNYESDTEISRLLDSYDWIFIPIVNPDGYEYTWGPDRMWRKNREPNTGSACIGTDLNRNFDTGYWGWSGTSDTPCSDTYGGPSAASAIETQVIQGYLQDVSSNLLTMVSIHGVASMWLHPWGQARSPDGVTCDIADDENDLDRVGEATIAAIEAFNAPGNANDWVAGSVCTTIYPASGGTVDYAYSIGIKYSYTPELREGAGFIPPTSEIQPSFEETWAGFVALIEEIEAIGMVQ